MSDFTPRDALAEVLDGDQSEYRKAAEAAKRAGLPETVEVAEMRLEYGLDDGVNKPWVYLSRGEAQQWRAKGDKFLVREVITTAWREVTP